MKSHEFITEADRKYTGEPLEKGGTSIPGNAAPPIQQLAKSGAIKPGMTVLDFGAGKFGRNSNFLRDLGIKVYSYDPYNGSSVDGWQDVSNALPKGAKFDVVFTSYVLNVVPDHIEDEILKMTAQLGAHQFHITRNKDIFDTVKRALLRKDKLVSEFFLTHFANDEEKEMFANDKLTDQVILDFCHYGVQTSKGFQRIPVLENKGYSLMRSTSGFKVYKK